MNRGASRVSGLRSDIDVAGPTLTPTRRSQLTRGREQERTKLALAPSRRTQWRFGIFGATLAFAGALAAWTVLTPGFRAPDEPQHTSTVLRLVFEGSYPRPGTATMEPAVLEAEKALGLPDPYQLNRLDDTGPGDIAARQSLETLHNASPAGEPDWMTQHPPLAYALIAGPSRLLGIGDMAPAAGLLAMRWLAMLTLLPVPWLLGWTVIRLGFSTPTAIAAAYVPVAVPQFAVIGASVTNGSLLVFSATVVLFLTVQVARGDLRTRTSLMLGLALASALLTKGFALALYPSVVLGYWVARKRSRAAWRASLAALAMSMLGAWWWVLNLIRYGTLQPSGLPLETLRYSNPPEEGTWRFLATFLDGVAATQVFNLNDFETTASPMVRRGLVALVVVLIATALVLALPSVRRALLIAVLPAVGVLLIAIYGSYGTWTQTSIVHGARGRYLQIALLAAAIVAAVLLDRLPRIVTQIFPWLAVFIAAVALNVGITHWWAGNDLGAMLRSLSAWWPMGGAIVVGGCCLLLAGVVLSARSIAVRSGDGASHPVRDSDQPAAGQGRGRSSQRLFLEFSRMGRLREQGLGA